LTGDPCSGRKGPRLLRVGQIADRLDHLRRGGMIRWFSTSVMDHSWPGLKRACTPFHDRINPLVITIAKVMCAPGGATARQSQLTDDLLGLSLSGNKDGEGEGFEPPRASRPGGFQLHFRS